LPFFLALTLASALLPTSLLVDAVLLGALFLGVLGVDKSFYFSVPYFK
jgi:hypothetical protein